MKTETRLVLERAYGYAKGAQKKLGAPSKSELAAAHREGYPASKDSRFGHDDLVARLIACARTIDARAVCAAFVVGVSGRWPRGRQPLLSYAFARHLEPHVIGRGAKAEHCATCGIPKRGTIDITDSLLTAYAGHAWNEGVETYTFDLEDFAKLDPPAPEKADLDALRAVLEIAGEAPPRCTPSQLERTLAKKKLLPSTDKYMRDGILQALAEVGVLPNDVLAPRWDAFVTQSAFMLAHKGLKGGSSEIVLPLAAWRGANGVDWARAERLFGVRRTHT